MNHVMTGILFPNDDFREIATQAFLVKHTGTETSAPSFNVSAGFIIEFKLRNGFSSRSCEIKRRPPFVSGGSSETFSIISQVYTEFEQHG
jgi:hypothetical protein